MAYKTIIGTMKTEGTLDISAGDIDLAAGSVDNADLAGSIANAKLVNDSVTVTAGNGLSGGGEVDLGAAVSVALDLNELTAAAVDVANDSIALIDATDNGSKKESIADLMAAAAGNGLSAASGVLALDANELSAAAVDRANDSFVLIDATDGSTKKESIADLAAAFADGDGIEASSGKLSVKVDDSSIEIDSDTVRLKDNGVTLAKMAGLARGKFIYGDASGDPAALAVGSAHQFLQADGSDLAWVSMSGDVTLAAGVASIGATKVTDAMLNDDVATGLAGNGLSAASGVLALDLNELSAAAVDRAADFFVMIDATDNSTKKESIADLAAAFADGDGIEAASGKLSVKVDDSSLEIDSDAVRVKAAGITDAMMNDDVATGLAGNGLAASSGVLAVGVDDSSIELSSDAVRVKAAGITNAMLAGSIANAKLVNSALTVGSTSVSLGGSATAFSGLTGLDFTAANASVAASLGANTLTIGGAASHVRIAGSLEVVGSVDTVSATELKVEDLTIQVASGSANSSASDGAGLKIDGADKSMTWSHGDQAFKFDADLYAAAGLSGRLHSISADATLTQGHFLVKVDTSGGAVTVTLPSSMPTGKVFVIKQGGHASNAVTIATAGSETIDGAASISLGSAYGAANLMFDGSNYLIW
jgi:hypothetical protein